MTKKKKPQDEVIPGLTYGPALLIACLYVGGRLFDEEQDPERSDKMLRALDAQLEQYQTLYNDPEAPLGPDLDIDGDMEISRDELLDCLGEDWDPRQAAILLVDLLFTRPFSPNYLEFDDEVRLNALVEISTRIGNPVFVLGGELVEGLDDEDIAQEILWRLTYLESSARKAHRKINWKRIALITAGGIALGAVTAGAAAPLIAGAIGAAAGLAGAAALAHGLAVLGFGSLAAGGLGMAGGLWIVTGVGAAVGGAAGGSSVSAAELLTAMGPNAAREEIVRLQVTTAAVTMELSVKEAARDIGQLAERRAELAEQIEEALETNDPDAPAISDREQTIKSLSNAIEWLNEQLEAA